MFTVATQGIEYSLLSTSDVSCLQSPGAGLGVGLGLGLTPLMTKLSPCKVSANSAVLLYVVS